jgi:hypothetical protein
MDCNSDGRPDACELDADFNGVPDECEPNHDCNGNGIDDAHDIASQRSLDCGGVIGQPDECEIAANPLLDRNLNGILDSCEQDPCEPHPGPAFVRWVGLPNSEQPWEAPYNWLPLQPSLKNRPGWDSVILDAAVTPRVMDTVLNCDQYAGGMELRQTMAFIALGDATLEFFDGDPIPGIPGSIRLLEDAQLQLDPRWPSIGSGGGLLQADVIESLGPTTLIASSEVTRIRVAERISLSGCEILLAGDTATPVFETPARSVMEANGTIRPNSGSCGKKLRCQIAGTLRSWRAPFDPDGSLVITNEAFGGTNGIVTQLEHASNSENPATLLLLWDWIGIPKSSIPVIDASTAGIGVTLRGAIQVDTSLAAGGMPGEETPSLELVRQPSSAALGRYSLISGTPPRGFRFEQRAESVKTELNSLFLEIVPEPGTDPVVGAGIGTRLSETEVGKVAVDLDGDGTDEIVIAVRRLPEPGEPPVSGELRVYKAESNRLVEKPEWNKELDAGDSIEPDRALVQPIRPWDGVSGDGQPLDAGDFDGDGDLDIAVACEGPAPFRLFENVGGLNRNTSLPVLADPIKAAALMTGQRPTCVAIVPARPGNSLAPSTRGFVGGVANGDFGILYRYSVSELIANRGAGVPIAGVPRSARGGGTVGTQGVGIATGGSTKTKTFNLLEELNGFVQWVPIDGAWNPQSSSSSGFGTVGKAVSMKGNAPCDLVLLPVSGTTDPVCIATANVRDEGGDVTVLRGSGVVSASQTGLDAIAPLRTGAVGVGAASINAANLFVKDGSDLADLLITRRDGKLSAARTDLDEKGSLAIGYVVQVGPTPDIDGNGLVDFGDINHLLLEMGPCKGCPSDLDGNGVVDFGDINLVLLSFGETS